MQEFKLKILEKSELDTIKPLINKYDFTDYKYCGVFSKKVFNEYVFKQILNILDKGGWIISVGKRKDILGVISLIKLDWGREIFDMEMAELKHLISYGTYKHKKKVINSLLSFVLRLCRQEGIKHLSCKINPSDIAVIHCLESIGFKIMDTLVTYIFNKRRYNLIKIRDFYKIRAFKEDDWEFLSNLIRGAIGRSRFYTDPYLPNKKVDDFFVKWLRDSVNGLLADKIFVAQGNSQIAGFLTYKINRLMHELSGFKIAGQGLSAVSPHSKGAYVSLMRASLQEAISVCDFGEYDTQVNNYEVIRIWQKFGLIFARAKYSFHKYFADNKR